VTDGYHGGSPSIERPGYWWYRARAELLRVALQRYVGRPGRILDVGSADGPSVGWLHEHGPVVPLDLDPRGLQPGGVCASADALPFAGATFEVVTAFDVVEHCVCEDAALAELSRVLVPGGRLLLSVPAYQWAWTGHDVENGHHRRYTRPRATRAVERAGLQLLRASYGFTSVFPAFAVERLLRRLRERGETGPTGPADVVGVPDLPPPVERMLMALTRVDQRLLARRDLPFGSSVLLAARKPG
jgi:SAM-dependent methyltransferase